jgi:hypothetical protein
VQGAGWCDMEGEKAGVGQHHFPLHLPVLSVHEHSLSCTDSEESSIKAGHSVSKPSSKPRCAAVRKHINIPARERHLERGAGTGRYGVEWGEGGK